MEVSVLRSSSPQWGSVRQWLNATRTARWTGLCGPIARPPPSPGLSPAYIGQWGQVKLHVHAVPARNIEHLVARFQAAVATVHVNILRQVRDTAVCLEADGGHIRQLMYEAHIL
jgi:hypothetical protein